MNARPLYFDYMATTPVDPRVVEVMVQYLSPTGHFGNPASITHVYGQKAALAVERARKQVATAIGATEADIIFTSGATEANNLAILGAARFYQRKGRHVITLSTEHKAVLDSFHQLAREGFEVTYLEPQSDGLLNISSLAEALREDTVLVSIMHVNNEIGVAQDIGAIGELLRGKGIVFHVDAAQATGKVEINLADLKVDLMSFCAHKTYGPKGVGALFVRRKPRIRIEAQIHGGGHERGMRSGTLPTHQIVGMGEAFRLARIDMGTENERIRMLRDRLWAGLSTIEEVYLNGDLEHRVPHTLNVSFNYVEGESMLMALKDVAISSGSACTSASLEPSFVLRALGRNDELAHSSIRFTVGRFTTVEEVDFTIELIKNKIAKLRELSPLWEMYKDGIDLSTIQWAAH